MRGQSSRIIAGGGTRLRQRGEVAVGLNRVTGDHAGVCRRLVRHIQELAGRIDGHALRAHVGGEWRKRRARKIAGRGDGKCRNSSATGICHVEKFSRRIGNDGFAALHPGQIGVAVVPQASADFVERPAGNGLIRIQGIDEARFGTHLQLPGSRERVVGRADAGGADRLRRRQSRPINRSNTVIRRRPVGARRNLHPASIGKNARGSELLRLAGQESNRRRRHFETHWNGRPNIQCRVSAGIARCGRDGRRTWGKRAGQAGWRNSRH